VLQHVGVVLVMAAVLSAQWSSSGGLRDKRVHGVPGRDMGHCREEVLAALEAPSMLVVKLLCYPACVLQVLNGLHKCRRRSRVLELNLGLWIGDHVPAILLMSMCWWGWQKKEEKKKQQQKRKQIDINQTQQGIGYGH
jgi:hypothetical protein